MDASTFIISISDLTHLDSFLFQLLATLELRGMNTGTFVQRAVGDLGQIWLLRTKACSLYELLAGDTPSASGSLDGDSPLLRLPVVPTGQNLC